MQGMISTSIMCADLANLEKDLRLLEEAGIEYIHVDIMDGSFVPNFTFGSDFCNALRRTTSIPLDIHLMVNEPEKHINIFNPQPGDYIVVHQEATVHLQRTLSMIKETGAKVGVAINPGTPLCMIEEVLSDVDMILVMTVNPGFAGQKLVPGTLDKIRRLKKMLAETGHDDILIQVDGNVSFENARKMRDAGADIFVAGSSSVFKKELTIEEGANKLRESIK